MMSLRLERASVARCLAGAALLWGLACAVAAQAANVLQHISANTQGGQVVVDLAFAQPLQSPPVGFTVDSPAAVVLDFPGVSSVLPMQALTASQGNLRSADVVQAQGRSRVVLNLRQSTLYTTRMQGNHLLVVMQAPRSALANPSASSMPVSPTVHFAKSRNVDQLALRSVDFHRGSGGSGRIVVGLPNNQVGVDIHQQGQNIVVDFLNTSLPSFLRRRMQVQDFATPVQSVTTFQVGRDVRMVVQPTGAYEQSAYQADNQFVLEVRPQAPKPNQLAAGSGPGYHGQKLSLNFQNIDVRSLLNVFANFTGLNVVVSDSVGGHLTLRLKDVPWDQALHIILQTQGLGERKEGNVLWIAPRSEIIAREQSELQAAKSREALEPLRTETFQLNYQKAAAVVALLTGATGGVRTGAPGTAPAPYPVLAGQTGTNPNTSRILSSRGTVIADPRTNQIFVTDVPAKLREIANFIHDIDKPVRQVLIEARIVEATDTFGRALGAKLGYWNNNLPGTGGNNPGAAIGGNYLGVGQATGQSLATGAALTDTQFVNLPSTTIANAALAGASAGTLAISLFNAGANRFINLELSALEADGQGKVISAPRVITADMQQAHIEQGTEIPYQQATSSGATAVSFAKAVLSLDVTPQITPDGNVIMNVQVHKDSVGQNTSSGPAINTNTISTQVQVENGGTVVLGGIYSSQQTNQTDKVPLLGDIPVLGYLFKTTSKSLQKDELMIFLTPRIVSNADLNH